jgi:pimeloyl-ACP methyl ester carboxylesterase
MLQKSFLGHSPLGFHRVAYTEWGKNSSHPPVICVHGLTRNGRDFDRLASALQDERPIFCPDVVGRGKSDWFADPAFYNYPQYVTDMTAFIARIGSDQVDWVGTSMGGMLGMLIASEPNSPIRRLVVNDVGPFIALDALKRIGAYAGLMPEFVNLAGAERYLRQIYAPFGIARDEDWRNITEHSVRALPNGKMTLDYDPEIGRAFLALETDVDLWDRFDCIRCPMLLLRGAQSDILSTATALEMTQRGPKPQLVEFPNVGHAPALMDPAQIRIIEGFLSP